MPIYSFNQSDKLTNLRIDGNELASFDSSVQRPLITKPLRCRPLSTSIFSGEKAKLQRARRHLAELARIIDDYMSSRPFHFHEVGDSVMARLDRLIPDEINVILGDVVHNLRSILDLLVCDLVRANGGSVTRDNAFPIVNKGIQPTHTRKQLEGLSQRAIKVLTRITHSPQWNEALLLLHGLDIMDKHNSLVAVGSAIVSVQASIGIPGLFVGPDGDLRIGGPGPDGAPLMRNAGAPVNFSAKFIFEQEAEVYRYIPETPQTIQILGDLVFGPGEKGEGAPILKTLDALSQAIERILVLCERRAI